HCHQHCVSYVRLFSLFTRVRAPRDLHSFPTRRSSDLLRAAWIGARVDAVNAAIIMRGCSSCSCRRRRARMAILVRARTLLTMPLEFADGRSSCGGAPINNQIVTDNELRHVR